MDETEYCKTSHINLRSQSECFISVNFRYLHGFCTEQKLVYWLTWTLAWLFPVVMQRLYNGGQHAFANKDVYKRWFAKRVEGLSALVTTLQLEAWYWGFNNCDSNKVLPLSKCISETKFAIEITCWRQQLQLLLQLLHSMRRQRQPRQLRQTVIRLMILTSHTVD